MELSGVGEGPTRHRHTHGCARTHTAWSSAANKPCVFHSAPAHSGVSPSAKGYGPLRVLPGAVGRVGVTAHDLRILCPMKTPQRCQESSPGEQPSSL